MSLITLKNDKNQQPWNFRNHFKSPIELPPRSSVSLVSAVVYKGDEIDIEDDNYWYGMIGDDTNSLNPVYKYRVAPSQDQFTPEEIMNEMNDEFNSMSGQSAFSKTGDNLVVGAWNATYNSSDSKVKVALTQNPLSPEGTLDTNVFPWSFDPAMWITPVVGDWLELQRSNAPGDEGRNTCGTIGGLSNDLHSGVIPRNGAHIIFQPQLIGGNYIPDTKMGLGETHNTGSSLAYYQGNFATAPFGLMYLEIYGPGGATAQRLRLMVNTGSPREDVNVNPPTSVLSNVLSLTPGTQYSFAYEWVSPYEIKVKYSTNYDPAVPATDWENATWTTLWDMSDPAVNQQIPTYNDNIAPMVSSRTQNTIKVRANWSNYAGGWDWETEGIVPADGDFDIQLGATFSGTLEGTYPNTFLKKQIQLLTNTEDATFDNTEFQKWNRDGGIVDTEFGKLLGFAGSTQLLVGNNDFSLYEYTGKNGTSNSYKLPTLHIQLTNFGINSKNGVNANNVKDVAVIPQFNDTEKQAVNTHLYYSSPYENKINLNNLQTININQIDCLITYDNNTQAEALKDYTTLVIKFHKGEEEDSKARLQFN